MKLDKLPYGQIDLLRLRCTSGVSIKVGNEVKIIYSERAAQSFVQVGSGKDDVVSVTGFDKKNDVLLSDLCTRNLPRLAWVVNTDKEIITPCVHLIKRLSGCVNSSL